MKTYIKAYTLFEVIISMVIISVISLIIFVLFSSFTKQLNLFNETNSKLSTYVFLKNNLKREFYISKSIRSLPNGIEIEMNDSLNIFYYLKDGYILKKVNYTIDTIPIKLANMDKKMTSNNYIKQLSLDFLIFNEPLNLVLDKKYTSKIEK